MEINGKHLCWVLNKIDKMIHYSYISTLQTLADRCTMHSRTAHFKLVLPSQLRPPVFSVAPGCAHTKMQLRRAVQS